MTSIPEPKCWTRHCKNLIGAVQTGSTPNGPVLAVVCKAFPDGIPNEIAYGDNSHTRPYPGDHGIRFEPREDAK